MHTQLLVLGGGPGGYAAAFLAADAGMDVTLVEQNARLGGTCLLQGCIPSKALLHVAHTISELARLRADGWGVDYTNVEIQLDKLRARKEKLVTTLSGGLVQLAKRRNVKVIAAHGQFADSTTMVLHGEDDSLRPDGRITFDHAVIATGSRPVIPAALKVDSPRVWTSGRALELNRVPESLLVVGGGYIGLELGTVYARLGSRVSVVELTDGLLPGVDRDLVRPLARRLDTLLEKRIALGTRVACLADVDNGVQAELECPDGGRTERFDAVLIAVGRQPVTTGLGLENTAVTLDTRGFLTCDSRQFTTDTRILAVGDVAGQPMLAHKATHQAKIAVAALTDQRAESRVPAVPAVVFTDPELAWVGLTEQTARAESIEFQTAVYPWAASGRAHSMGRPDGLTKWLFDPATKRLLGCGIVGVGAGELIGEAALALGTGCDVATLGNTIHPHPTLSETLTNAADVALGTAIEIYKPLRKRG